MPNIAIPDIIYLAKYIGAILIFLGIVMTPAYLARQTKKDGPTMGRTRLASWVFGWTGIGWLYALFLAAKK